jgi:TP901 family phage tail tape measure protein
MATEKIQIVISAVDKASGVFKKAGGAISQLGTASKVAATGIAAFGVKMGVDAVKQAAKFESMMSDVNTLFDDGGKSVGKMSTGIKDLLKNSPKSAEDLGASAYSIVSAGISDATEAVKVLDASQKLAVAGLGETSEATDILTSALNAFQIDAENANAVSNAFFLAVKGGKTTVSELAQGFGQVAPLANEMGIQFNDLISSTSAMTTSGLKASVAYTQIRSALSSMLKPTKEMEEAMSAANITNIQAELNANGMTATFAKLKTEAEANGISMAKMFGSVEALNAVLMLTGETGESANAMFEQMETNVTAVDIAYQKQTATTENQYKILKNKYNVAMMDLGNKILPIVVKIMEVLSNYAEEVGKRWDKMTTRLSYVFIAYQKIVDVINSVIDALRRAKQAMADSAIGQIAGKAIGAVTGRAGGGIVRQGETTLVGENGPELAQFPAGTRIIPNGGGGASITLNISGNTFLDDNSAEMFGDQLVRVLKQNMRI